jgi:hypothetical protein
MPDPAAEPHEYCAVHDQPIDGCRDAETCRGIMRSWGLYREPEEIRAKFRARLPAVLPPAPKLALTYDELAKYMTGISFPKYELRAHPGVIKELRRVSAPDEPSFLGAGRFASIDVIPIADWEPGRYELTRDGTVVFEGTLTPKPEAGGG